METPRALSPLQTSMKSSTFEAITALHAAGIKIVMLTGDNARTAASVAQSLGIDQVEAGVEPHEKSRYVQRLRERGDTVAMAGDGINDAPALAAGRCRDRDGNGNGCGD